MVKKAQAAPAPAQQALRTHRDRFLAINEGRLTRLRESLQTKQKQCLELLPLLFHTHLRGSPGYFVEADVPTGLIQYQPTQGTLNLLQAINFSARPGTARALNPQISGLYLMGSSGSVAQSTSSDLDIWLCYRPDLTPRQIDLLETKAEMISLWAEGFNLEVHFFLMNSQQFEAGDQRSLTGENCGSTQHFLLLDEFYRTGQLLAGAPPAWWFVPSDQEDRYESLVNDFRGRGVARLEESIDFGALPALPAGEFIGAGMWQLYKGIDSPHKSVLKLLLLEVYAREFPNVTSLAHQYKTAIHEGTTELNALDPYVMLYRRIERYLSEQQESSRLELIRRCFYFKVGIPLSKPAKSSTWRRTLMSELAKEWGWKSDYLAYLDGHTSWPIQDIMAERKLLINELTRSYRFLTQFAAEHQSNHMMSQQDLLILSRKLHAAFDRRRGKIDFISFGHQVDLSHEKIRIKEVGPRKGKPSYWVAHSQLPNGQIGSTLKKSSGLLETMLWCHLNGLLAAHLHIPVFSQFSAVTNFEVRKTLADLRQSLPLGMPPVAQSNFYKPAQVERVLLFSNLGCDPLQHLTRRGLQKISARSNSLDFSSLRENLVASIDMVVINSWGEVVVEHFDQADALPQAIHFLLSLLARQKYVHRPLLESFCHNQTRPSAIAKRIQDLFEDAVAALYDVARRQPVRFLYNLGEQYQALTINKRQLNSLSFDTEDELIDWLGQEQPRRSRLLPDRHFETDKNRLRAVIDQQEEEGVTLVYQVTKRIATVHVIDENGSLFCFRQAVRSKTSLLASLLRFLKVTEHRLRAHDSDLPPGTTPIQCYEMTLLPSGIPSMKRMRTSTLMEAKYDTHVPVVMELSPDGSPEYLVLCNNQEFSSQELGDEFFTQVADHMLRSRDDNEPCPLHITDLSLSDRVVASLPNGQAQSIHYLRYKMRLEHRINEAMQQQTSRQPSDTAPTRPSTAQRGQ
ncbi:hypothetical protein BGP77_16355 [Saccharospirillum sp. MSK14-1]|uniref:class I adenylate cyclase n=1 Tax=Saccharospirillum sp. MSK14-1 TaxID=1897632 RepID=UPI000D4A266A|nr:class I adenylate cyclase [Saccharospirillum sp. MSK14-1]PTY38026.1 hypothetical protein BGP77_16355 [Saccharospirillum sp. MSK14-1]